MANIGKVSAYYSTPGGATIDFLQASDESPSQSLFPGPTVLGTGTFLMWWRRPTSAGGDLLRVGSAAGNPRLILTSLSRTSIRLRLSNDAGTDVADMTGVAADDTAWLQLGVTFSPTRLGLWLKGVEAAFDTSLGGVFSAQDLFRIFTDNVQQDVTNIAVFERVLSASEFGALNEADNEHDLRYSAEGWVGEVPKFYWRESAIDGAVENHGYGGEVQLLLEGSATSTGFSVGYDEFPLPYPMKALESVTQTFGIESNHVGGVPATYLLSNYRAGDPYFRVKSTFRFPHGGTVLVHGRKFSFTSKTPETLDGLSGDWAYYNIPKGTRVFSVTEDIVPRAEAPGVSPRFEYAEQHYLQFNGAFDFATAVGAALGYSTQYALVVKLAGHVSLTANWAFVSHLSDPVPAAAFGNITDYQQIPGDDRYRFGGLKTDGSSNYTFDSAIGTQLNEPQLLVVARNMSSNTARARVVKIADQSVLWSPADAVAVVDSVPQDVVIGTLVDKDLVPITSVTAPYFFSDIKLVAALILKTVPTDTQLQAYAKLRDARPVFSTDIISYYAASKVSGTEIPNLGPNGVPLTLHGPAAGDLVAL